MTLNSYISIAILDETKDYIAIESISVMKNSCVLSGAWVLESTESIQKESLISNKLVLNISKETSKVQAKASQVNLSDFLRDAAGEAQIAIQEFNEYVAEDPKKRKNLVQPTFFDWPESIDLENITHYESVFKIKMDFENAQPEIRKVLAVSKLVQHLINSWHLDEQERCNRRYLDNVQVNYTLLPRSWAQLTD